MRENVVMQEMNLQEQVYVNGGNPFFRVAMKLLEYIGDTIIGESISNPGAAADAFKSGMDKVIEECQ